MSEKMNACIIANGKVMSFPAIFGITRIKEETMLVGSLNTQEKSINEFISNEETGLNELADKLSILPKNATDFSVCFISGGDNSAFILKTSGITCGITLSKDTKQLLVAANTEGLKNGNSFEQIVGKIVEHLFISDLALIVRNNGGNVKSLSLLKSISKDFENIKILDKFSNAQLLATGIFDLNNNDFGKNVNKLTGLNKLYLGIGGSFTDREFIALLKSEKIETDNFIMDGIEFGIKISGAEFLFYAQSKFQFKLENMLLDFTFNGAVSNTSFTLSASSDSRIPLNSRLSFSDLGMTIGIAGSGLSFGMMGRLNTNKLSLFGAFIINPAPPPPKITLLSAAMTSTTGRITLKDLIYEIADIQWDAADCLDVIALGDFDLKSANIGLKEDELIYPQMKADEVLSEYEKRKLSFEKKVIDGFNGNMNELLKITADYNLEPLGNITGQYILTDKNTMRHFRIDNTGTISLNCQIYLCYVPMQLGGYNMPVGMFICGTLEIFGIRARFLFSVEKGLSLVALFQMQKVVIGNIMTLSKSKKIMPFTPIDGGIAGQLLDKNNDGIDFYLCIQKEKGELIFYLNAYISLLGVFTFESLVYIKERNVYIDIMTNYAGFQLAIKLEGSLSSFTTSGYKAYISFDTQPFLDDLKKLQNQLKDVAKSVKNKLENAKEKIDEAQKEVCKLQSKINDFNGKINRCKDERNRCKWYQIAKKIAKDAEILAYEIAAAAVKVAIGVAYEALEIAKKALDLGGKAVEEVFNSVNYIINTAVQLLWIKSLELSVIANTKEQKISGKLVLTILGQDHEFSKEINIGKLVEDVKSFVTSSTQEQAEGVKQQIEDGHIVKGILISEIDNLLLEECRDIRKCRETYNEMDVLRDRMENLFLDVNDAYMDLYENEEPNARESSCILEQNRWEEEIFRQQHNESFDDEFVNSLTMVTNKIKSEASANNGEYSDMSLQEMDILLDIVKELNKENKNNDIKLKARPTLYERLEKRIEQHYTTNRFTGSINDLSADEVNNRYAENISDILNKHLGDQNGEVGMRLKESLNQALKDFKDKKDYLN